MSGEQYESIEGSERQPVDGARRIARADGDQHVDVTLVLRPQQGVDLSGIRLGARLSREEFADARGAHPADLEQVQRFARDTGLQIVRSSPARRSVSLSGTAFDMEKAFRTRLDIYQTAHGSTYRGRTGTINVPNYLSGRVTAVLGADDRIQAVHHSRVLDWMDDPTEAAAGARAADGSFTPPQVAQLYDFPTGDGSGQCIGIIELGGGLRRHDLRTYFNQLGITPPALRVVSVDGGRNHPTTASSADGEVMLDIEVAGAVAPGARLAVYFTPNTSRGFVDAITAAIHDTANQPSIISISWGGPENTWTNQTITAMDQAFADAAALGISVYCAAGDSGSSDGDRDGQAHVDFPASSPHVVACGGTHLAGSEGSISSEVVWQQNGATGGGISDYFGLPSWQQNAGVPPSANPPGTHIGRGVPDVAADADPATGYQIRVDGRQLVVGGTSAVAPLWSGLTALLNEQIGTNVGFLNPVLYQIAGGNAFHDITSGSNGAYSAKPGWDACTGWGSPSAPDLLAALNQI